MESEINYRALRFGAILVWIIVALFGAIAIMVMSELIRKNPIDLLMNDLSSLLAYITIFLLSGGGSFFIAYYLLYLKKHNKYTALVNEEGAFIFFQDGEISQQFLYSDLCATNENAYSDISVMINSKFNSMKLLVHQKTNSGEVQKHILSFQWEYYPLKNRFQLYQHYLKGVQIFRPDIKIQYITMLHFQLVPQPELTEKQKKYDRIFKIGFNIFVVAILAFIIFIIGMFIKIIFYK